MTVAKQVGILFILMAIGFVCNRIKLLSEEANGCIADLVMYIVTPCVIIKSFQRDFDPELMSGFCIVAIAAAAIHIVMIGIAHLLLRDNDESRRRVLRFGMVFSNAGFVALPLEEALLGEIGVFYGAAFLAIFNVFLWSYGIVEMSGDKSLLSPKKLIFSPGIIGIAVGLVIFIFSIKLPDVVSSTIGYVAGLNVPLPMILVGFYLGKMNFKKAFADVRSYLCIGLRLAVIPLLTLGALYLCGMRDAMLISCVVGASAPVGATTTIFSAKYHRDTELSVSLVSVSTLISMITMPLIVGLTQALA